MKVAVALDFATPMGERCLDVAHRLRKARDDQIILITVVATNSDAAAASQRLASVGDEVAHGPYERVVLVGEDVAGALCHFAALFAPHLLVCGGSVKTPMQRFALGSVGTKLLANCVVPVLIAR